jgi:hypothetical protein
MNDPHSVRRRDLRRVVRRVVIDDDHLEPVAGESLRLEAAQQCGK